MTMDEATPLKVALLGCGVVGSQVARLLIEQADDLRARIGRPLELVGIAVRRLSLERPGIDRALLTDDAMTLASRPDVDLVIELLGGIEPARSLILAAIGAGSSVITANKALLASDGGTIYAAAEAAGVDVYYEAAVAGAIPIIRPLRESLVGDEVTAVMGIVNGTTNFILDKMHTAGADFASVLAEAQELGFAEADPTADVEGYDAAAKAAILASLAFHTRVSAADVHREGITGVTAADVAGADQLGAVVKLLAICERTSSADADGVVREGVSVRVHPAMIPRSHPLGGVREAYNAVFVESEAAGQLMFYGRGAGGQPTASAVLGDVISVARNRVAGGRGPGESAHADLPVRPMGEVPTRYHISLDVADRPGVLAAVAQVFADHQVSIETVRQQQLGRTAEGVADGLDAHAGRAALVVVTHTAPDAALAATVEALASLDIVEGVQSVMRVEQ